MKLLDQTSHEALRRALELCDAQMQVDKRLRDAGAIPLRVRMDSFHRCLERCLAERSMEPLIDHLRVVDVVNADGETNDEVLAATVSYSITPILVGCLITYAKATETQIHEL